MAAISGRVLISTGMPVLNSFDGDALETLRIFRRPAVISLSDDELRAIMAAASPLRPRDRDAFLLDVAAELAKRAELGPGIVARLARELQRRHFDPPNLKGATLRVPRAGERLQSAKTRLEGTRTVGNNRIAGNLAPGIAPTAMGADSHDKGQR
jgi:hypothetical protein